MDFYSRAMFEGAAPYCLHIEKQSKIVSWLFLNEILNLMNQMGLFVYYGQHCSRMLAAVSLKATETFLLPICASLNLGLEFQSNSVFLKLEPYFRALEIWVVPTPILP